MDIRWKPSVTVAAVIERDGRFLLVEEETRDGHRQLRARRPDQRSGGPYTEASVWINDSGCRAPPR